MAVIDDSAKERIDDLIGRLHPRTARSGAIEELQELFSAGRFPDPAPSGFLSGRMITTSVHPLVDGLARAIADLWMPWLGKSFEPANERGVNVLIPSARGPLKAFWSSYEPEAERADGIDVFPFTTRRGPGEVDPDVEVLKIDYDIADNPTFVIRNILDELVEVSNGFYLGKILYRHRGVYRPVGFFTLAAP